MPVKCCVPGCSSNYKELSHRFPKNEAKSRQWLIAVQNERLNSKHKNVNNYENKLQ